jgi:D-beta-D-heptose 7-phosphate kinase/D-beta-D-heptose 1-phosphate adenosyltransferase
MQTHKSTPPDSHRGIRNWHFAVNRDPLELEWVRAERFEGHDLPRPLVLINGAYDLLHSGHMKIISHAREHAATLVCAMDSDRKIRASKGAARPIMNWVERYATMSYMPIDFIVEIDSDLEMRNLINRLRPDLRVQGSEYLTSVSKYPWLKKMLVTDSGIHTSEIIRRCKEVNSD